MVHLQKSPRLIAQEVKQYAEELQAAVDEFGMGQLDAAALEARFARLEVTNRTMLNAMLVGHSSSGLCTESAPDPRLPMTQANIPSLVARHLGRAVAEDPRVGDRVWVQKLSGEAVVERVSGGSVWVIPLDPGIALLGAWGSGGGGKSGGRAAKQGSLKYDQKDVQIVKRA